MTGRSRRAKIVCTLGPVTQTPEAIRAQAGDVVVITAGAPLGQPGSTNLLLIHRVGSNHGQAQ